MYTLSHKIFYVACVAVCQLDYSIQIQVQDFRNPYAGSTFIVHSEKFYSGFDVWVLSCNSQLQKKLITGILVALMAYRTQCSLSKVHPAISSGVAWDTVEHNLVKSCSKLRHDPVTRHYKSSCLDEQAPVCIRFRAILYACYAPLYASLQELPVFM